MPSSTDTRPWRRLYNAARWQRLRARQLSDHPLCHMCQEQGRVTIATVADHITEHKGDEQLFFDPTNLQSLCKPHHDATKQRQERRGYTIGTDASGHPIDASHIWNR